MKSVRSVKGVRSGGVRVQCVSGVSMGKGTVGKEKVGKVQVVGIGKSWLA